MSVLRLEFSNAGNKKRQELTHTGVKPHKCQYCEKEFSQVGNKKTHEMTHTGENPYKCLYCERSF